MKLECRSEVERVGRQRRFFERRWVFQHEDETGENDCTCCSNCDCELLVKQFATFLPNEVVFRSEFVEPLHNLAHIFTWLISGIPFTQASLKDIQPRPLIFCPTRVLYQGQPFIQTRDSDSCFFRRSLAKAPWGLVVVDLQNRKDGRVYRFTPRMTSCGLGVRRSSSPCGCYGFVP